MDFKGIAWAGNIYDKFEAMCLEVEEVIYEDTVKYVENQVQKVGASVKKFYSEVMQDILPPSCIDPVKVAAADLSPNPYAHADINKKPKLCTLESYGELKKKETTNNDNCGFNSKESSFGLHNDTYTQLPQSCKVFVESTNSGLCATKSNKVGVRKRPIGIKRISQANRPPRMCSPTSLSTERSSMAVREVKQGCTVASNNMNVTRSSESSLKCNPEGAKTGNISISDALEKSLASKKNLSAENQRQEKDNSELASDALDKVLSKADPPRLEKDNFECTSSFHGLPKGPTGASNNVSSFPKSGSSSTSHVCDAESVSRNVVTSYEDKSMQDGSFTQIYSDHMNSDAWDIDSANEEVVVSNEENFDMELIENDEVAESGGGVYEPVEESKLNHACVLVEGYITPQTEKHKPYKKKFGEVLSSELGSPRKQSHSIFQYKDLDGKCNADAISPELTVNKIAPAQDSFGTDWELI